MHTDPPDHSHLEAPPQLEQHPHMSVPGFVPQVPLPAQVQQPTQVVTLNDLGVVLQQMFNQMYLAQQRGLPAPAIPAILENRPSPMQVLEQRAQAGAFRFGGEAQDLVAPFPRSPPEWRSKMDLLLAKRSWNMGDMIAATFGWISIKGINNTDLCYEIITKIRDMSANEYQPVFEGMVNSEDPADYWEHLKFNASRISRLIEPRPFSAPRSSSPKGDAPRSAPVKKEKK